MATSLHPSRLLAFAGGIFLLAGCTEEHPSAGAPAGRPPVAVEIAKATAEDAPLYLEEIGNCVALQSVSISPQVSGAITEIHFKDGQEVSTGDLLYVIDPRSYQAVLDKANATLKADQATLELNSLQLKRNQSLVAGNFISPQDLATLKTTVDTNEAVTKEDEAAVETAKINLEYCRITSPIDGKTGIHQSDIGNVVSAYATTTLVNIQRLDPLYVDFIIAEKELPRVQEFLRTAPLTVKVYPPDDESKAHDAQLTFIDNTVQPNSGTVKLRATLDNHDRSFWPGQFVKLKMILTTLHQAVEVPASTVQISATGPFVFVVKEDSTVEVRPVKVGQTQGDKIILSSGVKVDETVVTEGQLMLSPGAKVIPTNGANPGSAPPEAPKH